MSVRYTAEAIMDGPALREVDRDGGDAAGLGMGARGASVPSLSNVHSWRERIEVRLDNRQVFFLFFGSALVACMLFVLGVMVGKRIESRGQADALPMALDPLAALDRARQPPPGVAAPDQPLTFQSTLVSGSGIAKGRPSTHSPGSVSGPRTSAIAKVPGAPKPIAIAKVPGAPKPIAIAKVPGAPKPIAIAKVPAEKPIAAAKPPAPSVDPAKAKGKFTLHLSTFATADEAEAFAQKYPGAFVVSGDVPGKGLSYRVRYGNYASYKDATAAKDSFEKQHNTIALIAAR
jgi:DedD protein